MTVKYNYVISGRAKLLFNFWNPFLLFIERMIYGLGFFLNISIWFTFSYVYNSKYKNIIGIYSLDSTWLGYYKLIYIY